MKLPLSWLREFVTIEADVDEICRAPDDGRARGREYRAARAGFERRLRRARARCRAPSQCRPPQSLRSRRRRGRAFQRRLRRAQRAGRDDRGVRARGRAAHRQRTRRRPSPGQPARRAAAAGRSDSRRALGGHAVLGARAGAFRTIMRESWRCRTTLRSGVDLAVVPAASTTRCSISRSRRIAAIASRFWGSRARSPRCSVETEAARRQLRDAQAAGRASDGAASGSGWSPRRRPSTAPVARSRSRY